jgi:hypothetical protein
VDVANSPPLFVLAHLFHPLVGVETGAQRNPLHVSSHLDLASRHERTMTLPVIGMTGRVKQPAHSTSRALFAVAQAFVRPVPESGGAPLIIPPHLEEAKSRPILKHIDEFLLLGGGDLQPGNR